MNFHQNPEQITDSFIFPPTFRDGVLGDLADRFSLVDIFHMRMCSFICVNLLNELYYFMRAIPCHLLPNYIYKTYIILLLSYFIKSVHASAYHHHHHHTLTTEQLQTLSHSQSKQKIDVVLKFCSNCCYLFFSSANTNQHMHAMACRILYNS